MRHADKHPTYQPGCFQCRIATVSVAPSAMPTRGGGAHAAQINQADRQLAKDSDAYRRLRKDGVQPMRRQGSAHLEQAAECAEQINTGMLHVKPRSFGVFAEEFHHAATEPQTTPLAPE